MTGSLYINLCRVMYVNMIWIL